ncbi:MAG: c-type cytochrome [Alphaproteobacteria bacterium]|nr:c-type cytochrome [Alphaproteobacteria bacterium]
MSAKTAAILAGLLVVPLAATAAPDPARLFTEHCAACHGGDRLGAIGPALLPQNLGRLKPGEAVGVILSGRVATQMPPFGDKLTEEDAKALAGWIFTAPERMPEWGVAEINASRVIHGARLPAAPVHDSRPLNLFCVVETGDHHVTVLDGDRMEPIARFQSRFALHGGIKYSPDGRFAYMASRDGWVSVYDLWGLEMVVETRAGINTRNIAVSKDGKLIAVGNAVPAGVVILDARDLSPVQMIPTGSRVSAVYTAPPRHSFVVALKDTPEVWELPYDTLPLAVRRVPLEAHLDDFFFDQGYRMLMGASRDGRGQVVDLDAGRKVADLALQGMPHLGSGTTFDWQGRRLMASPNLKEARITVIDTATWEVVRQIETLGPGFFLRGHAASPYVWADVFMGPNKDAIHVIDKRSLEIVKTLRPAPGRTAAHVEFTDDGRFALVSVMENDGALIVYDAQTLEEVKRLPMRRPVGKYNVANKIRYEEGTSH